MRDVAVKRQDRPRVSSVIVAVKCHRMLFRQNCSQQISYADLNGSWMSLSEAPLELQATRLLLGGHATLSSQRAIGVIEKVAGGDIDGNVVVKREVLAPLEGLETVDDDLTESRDTCELTGLNEQAVSPEASDVVGDGGGTTGYGACDLSVAHAADDHEHHVSAELGALLPIRCREGLRTKVTVARTACKPLDTVGATLANVETLAHERPLG